MNSEISEFTYGYALTEDFAVWEGTGLTAAPVFPSLIEEGQRGGYDVRLDNPGISLFLQFKLSDYMRGSKAEGFKQGLFNSPYFRFYLRSSRYSSQHNLLLALEQREQEVFYVAPAFHRSTELNEYYAGRTIRANSVFVPPSFIGQIDQAQHSVLFQPNGQIYSLSTPNKIKYLNSERFNERMATALHATHFKSGRASLEALSSTLTYLIIDYEHHSDLILTSLSNVSPLQKVAYLARAVFGCELFLVSEKKD